MSNPIGNAYTDDSGSCGKRLYSLQSGWTSRWTQPPSKRGAAFIAPHLQTLCKEEGSHHTPKRLCVTSDIPTSSELIREQDFRKASSENIPFCFIGPTRNGDYEANSPSCRKRNRSSFADDGNAMVATTHFSNDRKYEKYSAVLVHERNTFNPQSDFFARQAHARRLEGLPFSARIGSVGNLTATPSVLFTKGMGLMNESTQHGGVKIQPLWSSTDSDKDNNLGDAPSSKGDWTCQLSAETDTMDNVALSNQNDISGVHSSPLVQQTMRDETFVTTSVDPSEDKIRGKMAVAEMADASSMDGMEPSSSKTQSLEAEHLLCCTEQPSKSKSIPLNKDCSSQEASIRWVKRLKRSSSEVGESSSHENTHSKGLLISDKTMVNGKSLSGKGKKAIFQCSWIRRWFQDQNVAKHANFYNKGVVIYEPDSSKFPFDELKKKQFPSIAAMAMMGKSMNGYRPCKYTKRGLLVDWNTDDY